MNNDNEPEIDVPEENEFAGLPLSKLLPPTPTTPENPAITAAQAKVEAIADLTHSAYQKAGTLNLTKEETDQLTSEFPDEAFQQGAGGDPNLIYIEHAFLRDRLTKVFGMGQWAIVPRNRWAEPFVTQKGAEGSRVYVEAMLIVRGCFVAEAIGSMEYYPKNASQNYGDAVEGAKTAALRRCAKEMGVGLQAWKKDWCQGWFSRKLKATPRVLPPTPRAVKPAALPPEPTKEEMAAKAKKFAAMLADIKETATQFCVDQGWILPSGEGLEDVPFKHLPKTEKQFDGFVKSVNLWMQDGVVRDPYAVEQNVPQTPSAKDAWRSFPMPFGKNAGVKMEDLDKKYLYGMWANYEVEIEYKGKPRSPESIEKDQELRAMLDMAGEHYKFHHERMNLAPH